MKSKFLSALIFASLILNSSRSLFTAEFPRNATFSTLVTTEFSVEGLTGDATGNLYTAGRTVTNNTPCPVYRVNSSAGAASLVTVGFIPDPDGPGASLCGPTGLAFNAVGTLLVADGAAGAIYTLVPNESTRPTATVFASGVPGTNGIAFDRDGNLWTGDGTTGQGRVWRISPSGGDCAAQTGCVEAFRIQPLANEINLDATGTGGVGRDVRSLPPGTITVTPTTRNAANTAGSQPLVANGLAFASRETYERRRLDVGDVLYVADTGRGAIWKVEILRNGTLKSRTNCDETFTENTLCLENIFVAHPILEGADGIALDREGNIWVDTNERNAIAIVTHDKRVIEVFRNPLDQATRLRNTGPLEFPTGPVLLGNLFCTSNSDGNRRDNSPSTAGEIGGSGQNRGKISCMNEELKVPGLPLPVH
jgi:sugar lactone lactonase YvrE